MEAKMAKQKMMPYMQGYNNGYIPPRGSAGSEAIGEYSTKKNPRPVPKKGSSLSSASEYGRNADKEKIMRLKDEEARKESLRGMGC
jgi:hypothetical protein